MKKKRKKIDRSYYRTEEFKEKLRKAAEECMKDPEYLAECKLWEEACISDGLEELFNERKSEE